MEHSGYMAHGYCLLWEPRLVWLHVISDSLIGLSYFSIPIAMMYFLFKRRDSPFTHIIVAFTLIFFSCGMTHFFGALIIFYPVYWQEGYVMAATALISIIGAIMFIPMIPKALALPSLQKALEDIKGLNKTLGKQLEEQKIAEKALENSELRLSSVVETATDAIISINSQGEIVLWNKGAEQIFGFGSDEVYGKEMSFIVPPRYLEAHQQAINNMQATGGALKHKGKALELWGLRKDGTEFPIELTTAKWETTEGIFFTAIIRNITDRKKMEEQLRQSHKMEAIGTLAGGVAHDFNNILTAIIGFGSMAQKRVGDDEKTKKCIEEVLAGAERAAELTHSLLAYSRKQTIILTQLDINDIVRKINKMLVRVIGEDIKLTNILINRKLTVMADRGQIEQILLNLATNARDAMPEGGELTIQTGIFNIDSSYAEAHLIENTGLYAALTVSDTGIGMYQKTRENIFEPFFTTKEVGKGTGLGLSMVYGMVKQHGGNINVYSEPGNGTTFRIHLPMITDTTGAEQEAVQPVPLGSGETILLAEDDPQARKVTSMYLQEYGYNTIEAENGEETITKFLENKDTIAIVLLDVIMPVKNGREAYEAIKGIEPGIKTIFMSGYTDEIISKKGILEEGFDFISKPINPDALIRKIREVLTRREQK